jgi:Ca-activated chloride channel family protein
LQNRQVVRDIARLSCLALLAIPLLALKVGSAPQRVSPGAYASSSALFRIRTEPAPARQKPQTVIADKTMKVSVSLVTVPVMVSDKQGNYVPGLRESDFHIFENNGEQAIDRLIPEAEPFNVALMIDSSGSTHFKFGEMQDAALEFIDSLRPQDRVLVVSFGDEVHFGSDFTEDRARLRRSIHETRSEGGRTHLYDALEQVIKERLGRIAGRKAIVLFTDGVDNESRQAGSAGTLATIEKSDIIVYAIQYDTRKDGVPDRFQVPLPPGYPTFNMLYNDAVKYLRALTGHSGGRLYHAESTVSLKNAFVQIAEELRRQYTLCYYPANQKRDGSLRRIRVTVAQSGIIVRARTGYRAGK